MRSINKDLVKLFPTQYNKPFDFSNPGFIGSLSGEFSPLDVTGLKLWLKSDVGITKDGGNLVSNWADQSGNSNDLAQGTGTNQPLWVDAVYASKPTIRFDGVDNYIVKTTFTGGALVQPNTIFSVHTMPSANTETVYDGNGTSPQERHVMQRETGGYQMYAGLAPIVGTITTALAQYNALFNTTASELRRNKSSIGTYSVGTLDLNGFRLGANISPGQFADVDICEILIYDNDVSDVDRDLIETYLATRWGL